MDNDNVIAAVRRWVDSVVVGLNLCPFARRELVKNRVRFVLTEAATEERLLAALETELNLLGNDPSIETTLLIHPNVLEDFYDYNQFLNLSDRMLVQMKVEGVYQIASFHPDYRFGGTGPDDVENFTNRSPYPMLHIIREHSIERAIADYTDVEQIPTRNIELMKDLGRKKLQALLQACFEPADKAER